MRARTTEGSGRCGTLHVEVFGSLDTRGSESQEVRYRFVDDRRRRPGGESCCEMCRILPEDVICFASSVGLATAIPGYPPANVYSTWVHTGDEKVLHPSLRLFPFSLRLVSFSLWRSLTGAQGLSIHFRVSRFHPSEYQLSTMQRRGGLDAIYMRSWPADN